MTKEIKPIEFKSSMHKGSFLELENKKNHMIQVMKNIKEHIEAALLQPDYEQDSKLQKQVKISLTGVSKFLNQIKKEITKQKKLITKKSATALDALNSELLITLKLQEELKAGEPTPIVMKIFDSFIRSFTATMALTNTLVTGQRAA